MHIEIIDNILKVWVNDMDKLDCFETDPETVLNAPIKFSDMLENKEHEKVEIEQKEATMRYYRNVTKNISLNEELCLLRNEQKIYQPYFETLIDMYMLNLRAQKAYKEEFVDARDKRTFLRYQNAINCFNMEELMKCNNPQGRGYFESSNAELLLSICRISWVIDYLNDFSSTYNSLRLGEGRCFAIAREILKRERKKNSLIKGCIRDIEFINTHKDCNIYLYDEYRKNISKENEEDVIALLKLLS